MEKKQELIYGRSFILCRTADFDWRMLYGLGEYIRLKNKTLQRLLIANIPILEDAATPTEKLKEGTRADATSLGYAFDEKQFLSVLAELHEKQYIFVFRNGFVSWTEFGKRKLLK